MKKSLLLLSVFIIGTSLFAQQIDIEKSLIRSFRPTYTSHPKTEDLDKDGDPDLMYAILFDSIPIIWIDDDDDMKASDLEGDLDNDCLIIDRNGDGIFAGPEDLSIDWVDSNSDGRADLQVVVENGRPNIFSSNYMWVIDTDQDETFHYINWKELFLRCWEHYGSTTFYEDYHGQTLFQKIHRDSYRVNDLRYSWENPFLFYDPDKDGLTEMAIRLEDSYEVREDTTTESEINTYTTGMIDHTYMSFDLDNDNGPSNEFDFDLSIYFEGDGFPYADQIHSFDNMRGLPAADSLFYDVRWRKMNELVYTDHDAAWDLVYNQGEWDQCWLTFDEDDDCERWERVEFYQPRNPFKIGMRKGGLDDNPQADATGDRGEWDSDNSGQGKLYIGFDNRIHLYGAELGYWRIDQDAQSYQGWGGLYAGTYKRDQIIPEKFATLAYEDTNKDGFLDLIRYDLDGDTIFENSFNLNELGVKTSFEIYDPGANNPKDLNLLFEKAANQMWQQAESAIKSAEIHGLNYKWYAQLLHPKSLHEKYNYGYWLQFYLFSDFYNLSENTHNQELKEKSLKAYFGQNWELLR
jgi:hypothetical protein